MQGLPTAKKTEEDFVMNDIQSGIADNQPQEDIANDQVSMKEYYDPFTGEKYFGGKK